MILGATPEIRNMLSRYYRSHRIKVTCADMMPAMYYAMSKLMKHKIPNEKIKAVVGKFFYGLGVTITLGLSKYKYTAKFWNKVIEPWVIDFIDNIFG